MVHRRSSWAHSAIGVADLDAVDPTIRTPCPPVRTLRRLIQLIVGVFLAHQASIAVAAGDRAWIEDREIQGLDSKPFDGVIKLTKFTDGQRQGDPLYIRVSSGKLECHVPATDQGSYYLAVYYQADSVIRSEIWHTPDWPYPQRIRDLRAEAEPTLLSRPPMAGDVGAPTIPISSVIGLDVELGARALKGPGYAAGRVAMTNGGGALESVIGSPADCVRVDGSSGPCGSTSDSGDLSRTPLFGDLAGTIGNASVTKIQNRPVAPAVPSDGQALIWDASVGTWTPKTTVAAAPPASLGGDLGGSLAAATVTGLQDHRVRRVEPKDGQALAFSASDGSWGPVTLAPNPFSLVRSSNSVLTLGTECSQAVPCKGRIGNNVFTLPTPISVSIDPTSGTGEADFYLDSSGIIGVSYTFAALSCSPTNFCAATKVSSFFWPDGSIPLWAWTVTNGVWESRGIDVRAYLSGSPRILPGSGLLTVQYGATILIAADPNTQPQIWQTQATLDFGTIHTSSCTPAQIVPLAGALPGEPIVPGWPGTLPTGVLGQMKVSGFNQVSVNLCNLSGADQSPGALIYQAAVLRQFSYLPLTSTRDQGLHLEDTRPLTIQVPTGPDEAAEGVDYCYVRNNMPEACSDVQLRSCTSGCKITLQVPSGSSLKYRIRRASRTRGRTHSGWFVAPTAATAVE